MVQVPVTTLDDFVASNQAGGIDLIQIDTEGAELMVLMGGKRVLEKFKPEILAEYSTENSRQCGYEREEILRFMFALGYGWTQVGPEDVYFRHLKAFRF